MTSKANGLIHVDAYVKSDGTEVKEHYRERGPEAMGYKSSVREGEWEHAKRENANYRKNKKIPQSDMEKGPLKLLLENFFPKKNPGDFQMGVAGNTVLSGGVVFDEILGGDIEAPEGVLSGGEGFVGFIGSVVAVVAEVAVVAGKVAIEVAKEAAKASLEAQKSNNFQNMGQYDTQLSESISKLEESQDLLKEGMKTTMGKLVKTKDQKEYTKLLETYSQLDKLYSESSRTINRVKTSAQSKQYEQVVEDLKEHSSNYEKLARKNAGQKINYKPNAQNFYYGAAYGGEFKDQPAIKAQKASLLEKAQGAIYKNALRGVLPNASNSLQNAMSNLEAAHKNSCAFIAGSLNEIKNFELKNLMLKIGIPENSKGIIYPPGSMPSQKIAYSKELNKFISSNYTKLLNSQIKTTVLEFTPLNSPDLYLAFQHVTLFEPKIDSGGNFSTFVIDYYNFDKRSRPSLNPANYVNNWGYSMQEKGLLEKYYILMYIAKGRGIE